MIALLLLTLAAQDKRIPGPTVPIPAAERAELEAALKTLPPSSDPDVEIFRKAVDWALRYDEFTDKKQVAAARMLLKAATSPRPKTGLVVHGYRSRLDDSVQPYGLVVPASYAPTKKHRLDLWFHGRDEKLTELRFLEQRLKSPGEFTPAGAIVLHLYGRFCNASKFAGEVDAFEAIEDVKKRYSIDDDRILVRGFSMGGASAWHIGAHHAGLWAAVAPSAGFAETPAYARMFDDPVKPTEYEQALWRWYNATDYALNLANTTVVAYSGEIDKQKQAADIMAEAMRKEGLELAHLIGPKTGHKYEPKTKAELDRLIDAAAARGRVLPDRVRFVTWTLRYNRMHGVVVEGLEKHWEEARVDADFRTGAITTINVSALRLERPGSKVVLDRQPLTGSQFHKVAGKWQAGAPEGLRKKPGLQGPIDDAFMDRFVFVEPTGKPLNAAIGAWVDRELKAAVESWRRTLRGDVRRVKDVDLKPETIADSHLVLWGDPSSNAVLAQIAEKMPIRFDAPDREIPVLVCPNPLNPERYVVLNSGFTWRENASLSNSRHVPLLPDWAVLRLDAPERARMSQRVVRAGFFNERWEK